MKMKTLYIFALNFVIIFSKYNCDLDEVVYLSVSEIAFFETPNFPETPTTNDCSDGNLTFILKNEDEQINKVIMIKGYKDNNVFKDVSLVLAITYLNGWNSKAITDFLIFNSHVFSLYDFNYIEDSLISALRGYIIFENIIQNCPLESVTKPFNFNDETQIIFLHAKHPNFTTARDFKEHKKVINVTANKEYCQWNFTAPQGFGFKVVITQFMISSETDFFVTNSTDIVVNKRSVKLNHAFYNDDKTIQIYLSKREINFELYVSIVKTNAEIIDGNCTFEYGAVSYFWSTNDISDHGYYNNMQCSYNCTLMDKFELVVEVDIMALENSVDTLTYYTGDGKYGAIKIQSDPRIQQILTFSFIQKYVFFKFQTDGSFEDGGFNLRFVNRGCECTDPPVMPCPSDEFLIMKKPDSYHGLICSTLHCKFTIEPCNTSISQLTINNVHNYNFNNDYNMIYKVFSNNIVVFDFLTWQSNGIYEIFLNSTNENILEIHTFPDDIQLTIANITLYPFEVPEIDQHIMLSADKMESDIDLGFTNFTIFEMPKALFLQNIYFIVHGTYNDVDDIVSPILRNNETLSLNLFEREYCLFYYDTYKCEIKEKKFAVKTILATKEDDVKSQFLTVKLSNATNGCVFNDNIYLPKNSTNFTIAALSKKTDYCIVTMLFGDGYRITHLWTTSVNENVRIFVGTNFKNLLFEFNSKTASLWKDIVLLSRFYNIIIPKGSALYLMLSKTAEYIYEYQDQEINISQFPYQSLVTTIEYGISKSNDFCNGLSEGYILFNIGDFSVKFTVIQYEMEKTDELHFNDDNNLPVTKVGESFVFKNQTTVVLTALCSDHKSTAMGVAFFVETIK